MKVICIDQLFVTQCKKCRKIILHNDMTTKMYNIASINFCPHCGHKLDKENKEFIDVTDD